MLGQKGHDRNFHLLLIARPKQGLTQTYNQFYFEIFQKMADFCHDFKITSIFSSIQKSNTQKNNVPGWCILNGKLKNKIPNFLDLSSHTSILKQEINSNITCTRKCIKIHNLYMGVSKCEFLIIVTLSEHFKKITCDFELVSHILHPNL